MVLYSLYIYKKNRTKNTKKNVKIKQYKIVGIFQALYNIKKNTENNGINVLLHNKTFTNS